jgi:GNAT superfamily N-acetyltransferase
MLLFDVDPASLAGLEFEGDAPRPIDMDRVTLRIEPHINMTDRVQIARLTSLSPDLKTLQAEAVRQGFGFMDRLVSDWTSGTNTFSQPGECLLGGFADNRLVGIGGLNKDPYLARDDVGRVRHLYVLDSFRQRGIGRALVDRILSEARGVFGELRLRTDTEGAAAFYIRCGFCPVRDATASHTLILGAQT